MLQDVEMASALPCCPEGSFLAEADPVTVARAGNHQGSVCSDGELLPEGRRHRESRAQILAASAGWVAVLLNVVPGLGAGYLYQRRWKAYWITSALATAWFVAGAVLGQNADATAEAQNQLVGLIGLLVLAGVTATEAGLAVKRVRNNG